MEVPFTGWGGLDTTGKAPDAGLAGSLSDERQLHPHSVSRVRGQGLRSLVHAIAARHDRATVQTVFAGTSAHIRPTLASGNIAASAWYPITWYADTYRALREVTGAPLEIAASLRAEAVRRDAKGVFRFMLSFASPEALIRQAERVCALYIDGPKLKTRFVRTGELEIEFVNLVGYDECCVHDHVGGALAALEMSGARGITLRSLEIGPNVSTFVALLGWPA